MSRLAAIFRRGRSTIHKNSPGTLIVRLFTILLTLNGPPATILPAARVGKRPGEERYNTVVALAAGLVVVGLLVVWALILRRSP